MSESTPGPWKAVTYYAGTPLATVALVDCWRVTFNDARGTLLRGNPAADARLIAAAPEMYEALKVAITSHKNLYLAEFGEGADYTRDMTHQLLMAALAKAEGRS